MKRIWMFIDKTVRFVLNILCRVGHKKLTEEDYCSVLQFVKFGIIGLSNTFISYVIYILCLAFFLKNHLLLSFDYLVAQIVAFILSVLWSFYWNNKYVFIKKNDVKRNIFSSLIKTFLTYSFTGLFLNIIFSLIWVEIFDVSKEILPIINLLISVPINFVMNKYWAFKDKTGY